MSYSNIASATTTVCRSGKGFLSKIVVNTAVANGVITVYDNTAASGTKIATITMPATLLQNHFTLDFGKVMFNTGLTVVTSAATDITVVIE